MPARAKTMFKWLNTAIGSPSPYSKKRVFHEMPGRQTLGDEYYQEIADKIGVKPDMVRAIAVIESAEKGLTDLGYPVVRFEAHHWRKHRLNTRLAKKYDRAKNPKDLNDRWSQFLDIYDADAEAAVLSHSFGWPQIMGFNHTYCGFQTARSFLDAMRTIEGQGRAFVGFVNDQTSLKRAMQRRNVQDVALHYNGRNYDVNNYDVKLARLLDRGIGHVWT